jgi:hypothetical protein
MVCGREHRCTVRHSTTYPITLSASIRIDCWICIPAPRLVTRDRGRIESSISSYTAGLAARGL